MTAFNYAIMSHLNNLYDKKNSPSTAWAIHKIFLLDYSAGASIGAVKPGVGVVLGKVGAVGAA